MKLHINMPLVEALSQTLKYVMFFSGLLMNKQKFEKTSMVTLGEESSALF